MTFSSRNRALSLFIFFWMFGCATSTFEVIKQDDFVVELKVTPDRVLLECEPQPGHEIENAHGFIMYILDEKKTALTFAQFNILDREGCFNGRRKIEKILKTGRVIYVGGMGDMTGSYSRPDQKHTFPRLGTFSSNGKVIKFMAIANELGQCYEALGGDKNTCPPEPFSF
jgi:hypothetical protein